MAGGSLYFAFRGRDLLVRPEGARVEIPDSAAWVALGLASVRENDLGLVEGRHTVAVELPDDTTPPPGTTIEGLRRLHGRLDDASYRRAARAVQIVEWDRSHQYCGRCGGPVERARIHEDSPTSSAPEPPGEFAKRCARCRLSFHPRLSPAVIVLVERGDTVLLGRSARFPTGMYSTLAGFVEPGETLEEAVAREILEEAGIEVRSLRYFGSQPWPFPDSLMVAFTAEHAGGEIRVAPSELADANWFRADAMPIVPPRLSIARALIDAWVRRQGGDPDALRTVPV